jgi:peptide/nickel transport system ATP-binding protein
MSGRMIMNLTGAVARPGGAGSPAVLDGCTFSIRAGESVALVGESGAGKTTILRIIAGLIPLEDGRLVAPDRLGWLPQHPLSSFDPRWPAIKSVAESGVLAGLTKGNARREARKLLLSLDLSQKEWRRKPDTLSGGQMRRSAIARALLADPALVLADEPTAGLDPAAALELVDLFKKRVIDRGASMLWVTHDIGVAAVMADRVLVLEGGTIVEQAGMRSLVSAPRSAAAKKLLDSWLPLDPKRARQQVAKPGSVTALADVFPEEEDEED